MSADASVSGARGGLTGALMVVMSALSFSLAALWIHLTAQETNAFLFNLVAIVALMSCSGLFLCLTKRQYVDRYLTADNSSSGELRRLSTHFIYLKWDPSDKHFRLDALQLSKPKTWLRTPIVWIMAASFEIAFFVWSTKFVETGITSVVYELWPIGVVYALARLKNLDARFREGHESQDSAGRSSPRSHIGLIVFAAVGLVFMLGSQTSASGASPLDIFEFRAVVGIGLALIAAILTAASVVGTFPYGRYLYYRINKESAGSGNVPIEDRGADAQKMLLWFTILGHFAGRLVALPILLLSAFASGNVPEFRREAFLGAVLDGICGFCGVLLLRLGNIRWRPPSVVATSRP